MNSLSSLACVVFNEQSILWSCMVILLVRGRSSAESVTGHQVRAMNMRRILAVSYAF